MMPPTRKTWPRFDIHINNEVIPNPNISLSVFSMYGTITVWPIRCFFYYHVDSFALTHSKTHQSDVIWCRQHGRRDHSSISTLMTTLLRKQLLITISPFVSDCTIGYNLSVSYNTRLKSRWTIQSHTLYVPAKNHFDTFNIKQDIAVGIFHVRNNHFLTNQMFFDNHVASFASTHSKTRQSDVIWCRQYGRRDHGSISTLMKKLTVTVIYRCRYFPFYRTLTVWPIRCFLTIMSLLLHQHIRKHASRM